MTDVLPTAASSSLRFLPTATTDFAFYKSEKIPHQKTVDSDTTAADSPVSQSTQEFLTARPELRSAILELIRLQLALSDNRTTAIREILFTSSTVRVHDRLALASDLLTLLEVDLVAFLHEIGVQSSLSGLWTLGPDAQYIVLNTLARSNTPAGNQLIFEATEFGQEESRLAALDALLNLEDSGDSISILVSRLDDPNTTPAIRTRVLEYIEELVTVE